MCVLGGHLESAFVQPSVRQSCFPSPQHTLSYRQPLPGALPMNHSKLLPALLPLLLWAGATQAAFRCNVSLVDRGLTPLEVLERCGAPDFRSTRPALLAPGILMVVDEWLYEPGPTRFRRLLIFEHGRLARIETRAKPRLSAARIRSEL